MCTHVCPRELILDAFYLVCQAMRNKSRALRATTMQNNSIYEIFFPEPLPSSPYPLSMAKINVRVSSRVFMENVSSGITHTQPGFPGMAKIYCQLDD